ncbi:5-oxoprolinase subunit PxpB [Flagellimonas eckloniae]|uniref:Allophanate hydrolase n=1 Tax=Flagellimonas eckloniae TaxID=346185 RepID=A0A0Q1BFJ9_9FLAO|nr:5-oxoprolinase subunit PxpB [Allomuricauda eckloniae]KQC28986.1 allophanate hydrolase [Allomuricauda eckloniae]
MNKYPITIKPFGENAVLIEWPNKVEEVILDDILRFQAFLQLEIENDWEFIPAYNSLTLINLKTKIDFSTIEKQLLKMHKDSDSTSKRQNYLWKLPVCYDLEFGIDLEELSKELKMSIEELIKMHSSHEYIVYGIGFLPGFMYLGGLPKSLETQRKSEPRLKVEKGAVGLAGKQTGIYPQESPGGWNIIGNCPIPVFNLKSEEPCFVSVGDKIKFEAIPRAEYELHKIEGEVGIYTPEKIVLNA